MSGRRVTCSQGLACTSGGEAGRPGILLLSRPLARAAPAGCCRFGIESIDLWSLDVEGAELEVLETVDFSRLRVNAMVVEVREKGGKEGFPCAASPAPQDSSWVLGGGGGRCMHQDWVLGPRLLRPLSP